MIVNTNYPCDNKMLYIYLTQLQKKYPFFTFTSIGKSVLDRDIYCARLGYGKKNVFVCAAHHSLEWITTLVLLKFIEDYCQAKSENKKIFKYSIESLFINSSIYLVPLVNPDGVDIVLNPFNENTPYYDKLITMASARKIKSLWQANIRGVDLNHNYDAGFLEGKLLELDYNITGPGPTRYGGEYPQSEPETKAICDFVKSKDFNMALSYHSQGSVIYWQYLDKTPKESEHIVKIFSSVSGYLPDFTEGIASYRGFKDWFIEEFNRPAFTIEVGFGKNPLPLSQFDGIYLSNLEVLLLSALL